jgi:hypothetical protein
MLYNCIRDSIIKFLQVLVVLKNGKLAYQTVFMFSHRDPVTVSEFVTLRTVSGGRIQMSPSHYVWGAPTSLLHHSQNAAAPLRRHDAEGNYSQESEVRRGQEGEHDQQFGVVESVATSRRHLLSTYNLWLDVFEKSQVPPPLPLLVHRPQ